MADDLGGVLPGASDTGNPGDVDQDFVTQILTAFQDTALGPMMSRSGTRPGDVRACVLALRERLDALDMLLGGQAPAPASVQEAQTSSSASSGAPAQSGRPHPAFQAALEAGRAEANALDGSTVDEIGRNARARLRELTLLEAMAQDTRAFTLPQLMAALAQRGFSESTDAAVVSQLHRLKKNDVINQPANGMYEITDSGLAHLRKLRNSIGALLG